MKEFPNEGSTPSEQFSDTGYLQQEWSLKEHLVKGRFGILRRPIDISLLDASMLASFCIIYVKVENNL